MPPGLDALRPLEPEALAEAVALDRRLRAEAPVYRDPHSGVFLVSTYELVLAALQDEDTFSSRFASAGQAMGLAGAEDDPQILQFQQHSYAIVDTLLTADPPAHARYRALLDAALPARRVQALAPALAERCHELIDRFAARGRCEVRSEYAFPLSLSVLADLLRVPREDLAPLGRWTAGFTAHFGGLTGGEEDLEAMRRVLEFQHSFAVRIDEARQAPGDDLLSDLCRATAGGERPLDAGEILSILQQLLVAGHESAANAIAEGVRLLCLDPELGGNLRRNAALLPRFLEEVLRLASPMWALWRVARRDAQLGGVAIPAGARVLLRIGSANRDERVFPDPDHLDLERRDADAHLAFGHGSHACPGAELARAELRAAFGVLLERLGTLRLAPGAAAPRYRSSVLLRGLAELEVEFAPQRA